MPPIGDEDEVAGSEESQDLENEETAEEEEGESEEESFSDSDEEEESESEDEEEEQSEEDQDLDLEEDEEEEELEERPSGFKFKDKKTGNFDWDRINKRLGGGELQKTFLESQKTITRVSQEKKGLEEKVQQYEAEVPQLQQRAQYFDQFDYLFQTDPEVQKAVVSALQRQSGGTPGHGIQLPEGINPNDPLVPLLMETRQQLNYVLNQQRANEGRTREQQERDAERQGLTQARDRFSQLLGRLPTKEELGRVLKEMRTSGTRNGALLVPGLFVEEIQKNERRKLYKSRDEKRKLPKSPKQAVRGKPGTSKKPLSVREALDRAVDDLGIDFD